MLRLIFDYYLTAAFDEETLLVLVNAIYFKSDWDVKFHEDATIDSPFWVSHSQQIFVKMMRKTSKCRWKMHLKDMEAGLLALDYKGSRMCFVILLPDANDGLSNLEEKLESVDIGELDRDAVSTYVNLFLPKFKLEEELELNSVLQNLGLTDMFKKDTCDLSGISSSSAAYVSQVIHKAFLDVTEEGCEAAAATRICMLYLLSFSLINKY
ncbi:hypothetical protein Anas_02511 [Armadillidium nasatum]|uniref:Serpin domain-containing protein n=1 Tax=Armadillidium nasatum TaxID=96803 RepID=A0A5N5TEY4_9CRUS|nr:hypothetical protein Anas_02511 [Armadillidium nasatum]